MTRDENDMAVSTFIGRKAEFDALLEKLAALSDDHFGVVPDDVHWGHVGTVTDGVMLLRRLLAQLELTQISASSK